MRKCWKWSVLLPYLGVLIFLNTALAYSVVTGPVVENIYAVSEHELNQPSNATIIEIEWSLPDGYTYDAIEGYYYLFNQSEQYFFDEFYTGELHKDSQKAISENYEDYNFNGEFIYFHIAAVALDDDDDLIIGPTTRIGPFPIDTVPPKNVGVSTTPVTSDRTIELELIAESTNLEVFISNIAYVQSDIGWRPFNSTISWTVSESDGTKSIFVQFRDEAGNISKASTSTELIRAPSVTLQSPFSSPSNASTITVFAEFSQPVTLLENEIIVEKSAISHFSGVDTAYTIVLTPTSDGQIRLTIPEDAAGGIIELQTFEIVSDRTKPELSLETDTTIMLGSSFDKLYSVTAFDDIDGDISEKISVLGDVDTSNVGDTALIYSVIDRAGNSASVTRTIHVMESKFDVSIHSQLISPTNSPTIPVIVSFDRAVVSFEYTNISIENATIKDVSGNADVYTIILMPKDDGKVQVRIPENKAFDNLGNGNSESEIFEIVSDQTQPEVITLKSTPVSPAHTQPIHVEAVLSESVVNFNEDMLDISNADIMQDSFNGSYTAYSFDLIPQSEGDVIVTIDSGILKDLAGNTNQEKKELTIIYEPADYTPNIVHTEAGAYLPGHNYIVSVLIDFTKGMTSIGYEIDMPDGWIFIDFTSNQQGVEKHPDRYEFFLKDCIDKTQVAFDFEVFVPEAESEKTKHFAEKVTYRYADGPQKLEEASFDAIIQEFNADHSSTTSIYEPNVLVPVHISIQLKEETGLKNDLTALGLYVSLPEQWTYEKADGPLLYGRDDPENGESGLIHFYWTNVDDQLSNNPVSLTYYVMPPEGANSEAVLTSTVEYRFSSSLKKFKYLNDIVYTPKDTGPSFTVDTVGGAYLPGNQFVLAATMTFDNGASNIEYSVQLPDNWVFESAWGTKEDFMPDSTIVNNNEVVFQWNNNNISTFDDISFVYTVKVPENANDDTLPVQVIFTYEGKPYEADEDVLLEKQSIIADHSPKAEGYEYYPNGSVGIDVNIKLEKDVNPYNMLSAVGMLVQLPDEWSFYTLTNLAPLQNDITAMQYPENGDTGLLQFAWFDIQNNEIKFTYDVLTPTDTDSETITATVQYRFANGEKQFIKLDDLTFQLSTKPSIESITPENGTTTNSSVISLTFTEKVKNFDALDLTFFNGTLQAGSLHEVIDELAFTFTINVTEQGAFGFTIAEGAVNDYSGNKNKLLSYSYIYDSIQPEVVIQSEPITTTHSQSIPLTVMFSEPVFGFTKNSLTLSNANIEDNSFSGNNTIFTFNINPMNKGTMTVSVDSAVATDLAGNPNKASDELNLYYEPEPQNITLTVETTESGAYLPGHNYIVSVSMYFTKGMTSIGYTIDMPDDWIFSDFSSNPQGIEKNSDRFEFYLKDCIDLSSLTFDFAVKVPDNESQNSRHFSEEVTYRFADGPQNIKYSSFDAEKQTLVAEHSSNTNFYVSNVQIPINVKIQLTKETGTKNDLSSLGLHVYLPEEWKYEKADGPLEYGFEDPDQGTTGLLKFYWFDVDDHLSNNPINLTYYVLPPANADSAAILTSTVEYRFSDSSKRFKPLDDLKFEIADPTDVTPPDVLKMEFLSESLNTVAPVKLRITLSESLYYFDKVNNIDVLPSGDVVSIIQSESNENAYTAIIQPDVCGELFVSVFNLMDKAGNVQTEGIRSEILTIDCTTYRGKVYENDVDDGNALPDVAVSVDFPEDDTYPVSITNDDGFYALHLRRMDEKKYSFRFEKSNYLVRSITSKSTPDQISFVHELPDMILEKVEPESYQYTIVCKVTADSQKPQTTVKICSANSEPTSNVTAVIMYDEVDSNDEYNLYYLYYLTRPTSIIISASMKDYYEDFEINSISDTEMTKIIDLDMQKPELPEPEETYISTSKVVSKESGGKVILQSSTGVSVAEIEILPGAIDADAEVEIETKDKGNSSFAAHSQLVDIETKAGVIGELIVKIKTTSKIEEILRGKHAVFWADNPQAFMAGNVHEIPLENFLEVDQEPGFIRFKMRHLTTVGVGNTGLKDLDTGQRRCFISTLQSISFNPMIVIFALTILIVFFRKQFFRI